MKKYIGVKLIEAEPGVNLMGEDGYHVIYQDGYESWSPKDVFEAAYMQVGDNNTITQENVDNFIQEVETTEWKDKTTVVHATLKNGFMITESSSCVDPANFDPLIGRDICVDRIKNKVWELLGFLLQCGVKGLKGE